MSTKNQQVNTQNNKKQKIQKAIFSLKKKGFYIKKTDNKKTPYNVRGDFGFGDMKRRTFKVGVEDLLDIHDKYC